MSERVQAYMPNYVERWLNAGLESRLADERLVSPVSANIYDSEHGTSYGEHVLGRYMEQCGLAFEPSTHPELYYYSGPETPRRIHLAQKVTRAIGTLIGVQTAWCELISARAGVAAVTVVSATKMCI